MEYIIITLFGIFIGISIAGYMFVNEINKKERKIANQKAMINNRNEKIEDYCNKIALIIKAVNKGYYAVETLEDEIKRVLSNDGKSEK